MTDEAKLGGLPRVAMPRHDVVGRRTISRPSSSSISAAATERLAVGGDDALASSTAERWIELLT